ncbi:hypothetical protein VPH35_009682 [Triticum aestivum]
MFPLKNSFVPLSSTSELLVAAALISATRGQGKWRTLVWSFFWTLSTGSRRGRSTRTTLNIDPVPLVLLPTRETNRGDPEDSNVGSGCGQWLGDDGADKARDGVRRRSDSSPTMSAQSTDKVNPQAPSWKKKVVAG